MMEITHLSTPTYVYAVGKCSLNVRIQTNCFIREINIYYQNLYDHSKNLLKKPMTLLLAGGSHWLYEATISIEERHFKYYFELNVDDEFRYYTCDGLMEEALPVNYFYYSAINDDEILTLPAWAEGELIYQVLIDRFHDGNPLNNPQNCRSPQELPDRNTYYGGDFQGIVQKMDYLQSLGVKIIYLSPLFRSPTYHKYDVQDYYQIEDLYGGESGLKELVEAAHRRGLKVILDGIFNHCSSEHPFFQDLLRNNENSPYKSWFNVYSFPVNPEALNYDSFACQVPSMPRFNTANPEVIAYLTDVAAHWTRTLDIDGWRLDVADEVAPSFWREFRRKVKTVRPDAIIIGEVWNQASKWLYGDQFDTVTNYKYRQYLLEFLQEKIDSQEFWRRVMRNLSLYHTPTHNYLVNLVGSHDTIRLITALKNEKLHFLALAFTLLLNGMPLIYYGDEVGLEGDVDPDNRRAFPWERISRKELKMLQDIGRIRSASAVLKKGNLLPLVTAGRLLGFKRRYDDEEIIVYGNFSGISEDLPGDTGAIIFGEYILASGKISIPPYGIILMKNK